MNEMPCRRASRGGASIARRRWSALPARRRRGGATVRAGPVRLVTHVPRVVRQPTGHVDGRHVDTGARHLGRAWHRAGHHPGTAASRAAYSRGRSPAGARAAATLRASVQRRPRSQVACVVGRAAGVALPQWGLGTASVPRTPRCARRDERRSRGRRRGATRARVRAGGRGTRGDCCAADMGCVDLRAVPRGPRKAAISLPCTSRSRDGMQAPVGRGVTTEPVSRRQRRERPGVGLLGVLYL